jgi:hypothetical protein
MKKLLLALVGAACIASTASAAAITLTNSITSQVNQGIIASSVSGTGDTSIIFSSLTFNLGGCSLVTLCGSGGTVTGSSTTFTSGVAYTFTFTGTLGTTTYTTSGPWAINQTGNFFDLGTSGTYSTTVAGFTDTPGTFNISFQGPASSAEIPLYSFSGQGISNPVPEPASLVLMGSGLLGLGFLVRRRKFRA